MAFLQSLTPKDFAELLQQTEFYSKIRTVALTLPMFRRTLINTTIMRQKETNSTYI
jgi:hypothetical protein